MPHDINGPDDGDAFGRIEQVGVEYIPESGRDSKPANLFAVFFGGNLAFSVIVFGWLPITFGLSFWAALASSAVGLTIGLLISAPLSLFGPRTGTNNTVSSGAHFGIRGRFIGSGLTLLFALAYAAIAVWTSGDALVGAAHRLLGTPDNDLARGIGYAVISAEIIAVALFGHATLVRLQKFVIPVVGILLVLGLFAFGGSFVPSAGGGDYLLGSFWPTFTLAVAISIGGPLSYAPTLGDYTRRIPHRKYSDRTIMFWTSAGIFLGLFLTSAFGSFTAVTFTDPSDSYVADLISYSPTWYVLPILVIALAGGLGQGVINLYASGLDLESLMPRLRRVHTTLITSVLAVALLYVGVFVFNAVDAITAMTLVLNGLAGPWVAIMLVGFLMSRGRYDPVDLQAFASGRHGGRYWYRAGWNWRAVCAFVVGSAFGLLSVNTTLYVGPMADIAGGVDVSVIGSALVAGLCFFALQRIGDKGEPVRPPAPVAVHAEAHVDTMIGQ